MAGVNDVGTNALAVARISPSGLASAGTPIGGIIFAFMLGWFKLVCIDCGIEGVAGTRADLNPGGGMAGAAELIAEGAGTMEGTKELDETESPRLLPYDETVLSSSPPMEPIECKP